MAVTRELTLTEELFRATQLNKYKETIDPIMPGSGLPEKMFEGSQHTANYVLDTHLTFKVNKWKKGKTTKTKKVLNPNIMFTMFGVFCDKSAGAIRKDLCEWISANLESFKRQCLMGMASKDIDFDEWFSKLKSNDTGCDEFGLSALCQAFQRHALVVTSHKIWTTIPASYNKTPEEERRLCDVHFLYMYPNTFGCLEPKFQWKREFPIGELQLMPSQEPSTGPLTNITDKTLDKEANANNIVKDEVVTDNKNLPEEPRGSVIDELGLVTVPPLPSTSNELPDATQNLLVSLPVDEELTDATAALQTETEPASVIGLVSEIPITVQCPINLTDISGQLVDGKLILPPSKIPLEPQVIVEQTRYNLRQRSVSTTDVKRPKCKASSNVNYGNMDTTTEEEEFSLSESERMNLPAKSAPSGYHFATHKYMLAKCHGLIQGPTTRTRAMKIAKPEPVSSIDSEATEDYVEPTEHVKHKRKSKKPTKSTKPKRSGMLITRSYFLRKDGKGTSANVKPR